MRPENLVPGQTRLKVRLRFSDIVEDASNNYAGTQMEFTFMGKVEVTGYAIGRFACADLVGQCVVLCEIGPHNGVLGWQASVPWDDVLEVVGN